MVFDFPERSFVFSGGQTANRALRLYRNWEANHPAITRVEEYLINSRTNVGMLLKSARYPTDANTVEYREGHDNTLDEEALYYRAYSYVIKLVRRFFTLYPTYHLMVDVRSANHQCMLYIVRDSASGMYTFYGFDPNREKVASCLYNFAHLISARVKSMNVWTSSVCNEHGLCYSMTWRFLHLIMFEEYNPILNERIGLQYIFKSKAKKILTDQGTRRSSIGYVKTGNDYHLTVHRPE